ncbi:acetylcholinesterase/Butyrylcholinesterase [Pseudocercospora fijiensis CIRAD86]|uniref:Carboxylic ester hydrolase n=1 Tax=Pseudocercospora fijiensis (strain CIRAD86) TaxID=383855 RepID=N1QBD7_PSEFD|nr:acetylcholinesterase/Butyrylcholinesterase [Pseudocercospora fijiensis CIRAD86]EME88467.1 acetylcholinesterase/Butyrylcholinesterase [Pseudocercospora fijiensis CIRAD86]
MKPRSCYQFVALLSIAQSKPLHHKDDSLLIEKDNFAVQGTIWPNNSDVQFFGNIPYAEPPLGELRFRPPVTKSASSEVINGTWFGPSCIQYSNGEKTVYTELLRGFLLSPGQSQSEDCLTVNIWRRKDARAGDNLPFMIWIHGGGHTSGGSASPYKYGDRLARDQNVIVVSMNYRLNIFGSPGASALDGRNLNPGLMDQRKAVEWVYTNIHAFGGDAEKMVLFGQSAGGGSVDMYTYAYPNDPLVKGFIAQSGTASNGAVPNGSNFTYVASKVGCGTTSSADEEFQCMQKANATALIQVYNTYHAPLNHGKPLSFSTAADNQTRFSNYTNLQTRGLFAKRPIIYSTMNNEGASLATYIPGSEPNETAVAITNAGTTCSANQAALAKSSHGVPTFRIRYFGEWPNLNPLEWLGSYHSSDLPMIFGTSDLRGADTELEKGMRRDYQGAWGAFARDPERGLEGYDGGWPEFEEGSLKVVELGREGISGKVVREGDADYGFDCGQK